MTEMLTRLPEPGQTIEAMTIGSLCTGYAGLDMGVSAALGGNAALAWVADHDPHIIDLLAHRFPDATQLGDLSAVRWSRVEHVDVITAGFPCQDISAAGRGAGIEKGERSGVWKYVMDAIRYLRPDLAVLENVPALRWNGRGFGRVLTDLAFAGYDARWCCVRASDIGAPHKRERVFVIAHPPPARTPVAHSLRERSDQGAPPKEESRTAPHTSLRGHHYDDRNGSWHPPEQSAYSWGEHEPAIRRWERILGRTAPPLTETGTRGQPRLSAACVEWMMGLPSGWVTDPHLGMPHTAQIRALGNGVVPQQATVAVRHLLDDTAHDLLLPHGRCRSACLSCGAPGGCRGNYGNRGSAG